MKIRLKDIKDMLLGGVMFMKFDDEGFDESLYTTKDFQIDRNIPDELWDMTVKTFNSYYDEDENYDYIVMFLA